VLDDGPAISGLAVERLEATRAIVGWTTTGDTDSTIGWGTTEGTCPWGYHRTGGRRDHRLAVGPLEPDTTYYVTVRSSDDTDADQQTLTFTTPALPTATELTACGVIDTPGTYRLAADVQADCTCFEVTASDVVLDLGWHTVTYATSATGEQCHGLELRGDNVEVSGGIVEQGTAGGDLYSHAVAVRGNVGTLVEQLWLRVHTADAFGLRSMYADDVTVRHVLLVSEVTEVTDRHYPGNRGIGLDLPDTGPGEVSDCVLFGVPHWGINLTGGDRLDTRPTGGPTRFVLNNHVFADMHATNGYGLGIHANLVEVAWNEVRPLYNGRALHYTRSGGVIHHNIIEALERIEGDPAQGFSYYSDTSDPASPHDASVCSWVVAHSIRVEGGNFGEIHHNETYAYSLADVSFGATGLNINTDTGAQGGNEVHSNQFVTTEAPSSISCSGGLPMRAGWVWGDPPVTAADLHDNRFVSTGDTLDIEDPSLATSTNDQLVQQ
jgi:hypothetical protein